MMDEKQAKRFLKGLARYEEKVREDPRANVDYWNADDWGSISGIRDAEEWVESQLARYVLRWIRRAEAKKGKR